MEPVADVKLPKEPGQYLKLPLKVNGSVYTLGITAPEDSEKVSPMAYYRVYAQRNGLPWYCGLLVAVELLETDLVLWQVISRNFGAFSFTNSELTRVLEVLIQYNLEGIKSGSARRGILFHS